MVVRYPVETPTRWQLAWKVFTTAVVLITAAIVFGAAAGYVISRVLLTLTEMV